MTKESSKQINKNLGKLVRIDPYWHQMLKVVAAKHQMSVKSLLEGVLAEYLEEYLEEQGE